VWQRSRLAFVIIGSLVLVWQWSPAANAVLYAGLDPSTHAGYHQPLVDFLRSRAGPPPRVEIPFTLDHWEAAYVAPDIPLARGWERQLDIGMNPLFYDGSLSASSYHRWLVENAVRYVALPDVPLDPSSTVEADTLRNGQPFLRPVWHNEHWRVWIVVDAKRLVSGPARVIAAAPDSLRLLVTAPGTVVVRVHYTPHWVLDRPGCVEPTREGWTRVHVPSPGRMLLATDLVESSTCD
jgi:hypothetical protein